MERSVHRTNKILEPFLYKITTLIRNPSSSYRIPSFGLLLHHLNYNRSASSTNATILPAILSALMCDDNEVSSTIRNKIDTLSMCKGIIIPLNLSKFIIKW